ncbi:MAG: hypothetical protein ACYC4S_11270 [Rhodoferax sp.]
MNYSNSFPLAASDASRTTTLMLGLPFDMAREQYANAIRLGLVKHSMLASTKFAQALHALEQATLGPWARRV